MIIQKSLMIMPAVKFHQTIIDRHGNAAAPGSLPGCALPPSLQTPRMLFYEAVVSPGYRRVAKSGHFEFQSTRNT